jgi:IMP dehydrogenase
MTNPLDSEFLSANDVLLVPQPGVLASRKQAQLKPYIYSAPMDTVTGYDLAAAMLHNNQLPVVSRFIPESERLNCLVDLGWHENAFFAVGFGDVDKFLELAAIAAVKGEWPEPFKINLAIDVAHGDMMRAHSLAATLRKNPFVRHIMSGSVCTSGAARRAADNGCTHIRVGVGPGAVCTTRLMTGCGFPQLSAVYEIYKAFGRGTNIEIIADGGIKHPGDAVKYLAAGASGVMLGSMLSKCKEAPGWNSDGWKNYRGQASGDFQRDHYGSEAVCPEGVTTKPFKWNGEYVTSTVNRFNGGVRSAISYLGLTSIEDLQPNTVRFIKVTPATFVEGTPHGV